MKIFSAAQIREWDIATVREQGITSAQLMERAAAACAAWLSEHMPKDALYVVLCGMGNNGGDGLVIARLLRQQGYGVKAFVLRHSDQASRDHQLNEERLRRIDVSILADLQPGTFITDIAPHIILIDAIMGTGLSRPLQGWLAEFITRINALPNPRISIDLPSGLSADEVLPGTVAVQATHTLSFQEYKRLFLHPEGGTTAGRIHLLDIGLSQAYQAATPTNYHTLDAQVVRQHYRPRQPFSHKGTYGTALLIGGSYGMIGAMALAVKAAARSGAGKVRALVPECGYGILQTLVPEAMTLSRGKEHLTDLEELEDRAEGIGLGPGMGTDPDTAEALATFIESSRQPLVLDADALNILARRPELLSRLPAGSILTPHPKEFGRLFGPTADSLRRAEQARAMAMKYNICIVGKDRHTIVATPEGECWYNLSGNAGMATGGSGDVLCGMLAGLLAQGYDPVSAALMGVWLHGRAGDLAVRRYGQEALMAGDITEHIGEAFMELA